jgi:hypothetical protein
MPSIQGKCQRGLGPVLGVQIAVGQDDEEALRRSGKTAPAPVAIAALIDIGAGRTVLQRGIAGQLGLLSVGTARPITASGTGRSASIYAVRLILSPALVFEITVVEMPLPSPHVQCLIGRDVLDRGVLVYDGPAGVFSLTF